jgi:hypothetical protein
MTETYYTSRKGKLLKDFDKAGGWLRPHLIEKYGEAFANLVREQARAEYEALIPQIPFIGGAKVHMTSDLLESAQHLAYLRVLKAHGKTNEECREIIFRGMRTRIAHYPKFLLKILGWMSFTKPYLKNLQRQASDSQKRQYPGGFVFGVLIGDGEDFDWGLDFAECGIRKFYQAQNASELLPIVCPIDYVLSDAFGYGLVRTQTLAEGAPKCNPRMKRGRQTEWRLPSLSFR